MRFEVCRDVPYGGVLCALPALIANGLLDGIERHLNRLKGYYTEVPVLILMGLMALCRIKTQTTGHRYWFRKDFDLFLYIMFIMFLHFTRARV